MKPKMKANAKKERLQMKQIEFIPEELQIVKQLDRGSSHTDVQNG